MKKLIFAVMTIILTIGIFAACTPVDEAPKGIAVVSREEGSGTRGAFEELIGYKAADGDNLPTGATTLNSTGAVLTQVAGNTNAIGYVSLGSLNDTVKALKINDVEATSANVLNASYPLFRPFLLVSKKQVSELSAFEKDFYDFLNSTTAQTIIGNSYISIRDGAAYTAKYTSSGKGSDAVITISGSTSVQPIMNSLVGRYLELNTGLTNSDIVVTGGGSGAGITNAINEVTTFGMSSRELKSSEVSQLAPQYIICKDGIAVVVHKNNPLTNVTVAQQKQIYTGEITLYSELSN